MAAMQTGKNIDFSMLAFQITVWPTSMKSALNYGEVFWINSLHFMLKLIVSENVHCTFFAISWWSQL